MIAKSLITWPHGLTFPPSFEKGKNKGARPSRSIRPANLIWTEGLDHEWVSLNSLSSLLVLLSLFGSFWALQAFLVRVSTLDHVGQLVHFLFMSLGCNFLYACLTLLPHRRRAESIIRVTHQAACTAQIGMTYIIGWEVGLQPIFLVQGKLLLLRQLHTWHCKRKGIFRSHDAIHGRSRPPTSVTQ